MEVFSDPRYVFDLRRIIFNILMIDEGMPRKYHLILAFQPQNSSAIMLILGDLGEEALI